MPLYAETSDAIGKPLKGHSSSVFSVAFSPDGSRIVSGSLNNTIRLWDAKLSHVVSTLGCTCYSLLPSGWVINSNAEKLFWVPPWHRVGLCFPRNIMTISQEGVSMLDMSQFVHGTAWETCRTGWISAYYNSFFSPSNPFRIYFLPSVSRDILTLSLTRHQQTQSHWLCYVVLTTLILKRWQDTDWPCSQIELYAPGEQLTWGENRGTTLGAKWYWYW